MPRSSHALKKRQEAILERLRLAALCQHESQEPAELAFQARLAADSRLQSLWQKMASIIEATNADAAKLPAKELHRLMMADERGRRLLGEWTAIAVELGK